MLEAQARLAERGVRARVVSMPSHELFLRQDEGYRREVLPAGVKRIAIEAAHPMSWQRFVGDDGVVMGIERFGASAPYQRIYQEFGLTPEQMVATALRLLGR